MPAACGNTCRWCKRGWWAWGRFSPPGQPDRGPSKAWAYPVVANGRLFIRDLDALWCYEVK